MIGVLHDLLGGDNFHRAFLLRSDVSNAGDWMWEKQFEMGTVSTHIRHSEDQ